MRYHVTSYVAGRRFEELTVAVGFDDPPTAEPERLRGTALLGFAEIAPVEVPALPLEQHMAEKVRAYTRCYAGGRPSARTKDLLDRVVVSSLFAFQTGPLWGAPRATFDARGARALPAALPPPPPGWGPTYRKLADEVRLEPDVSIGYRTAPPSSIRSSACRSPTTRDGLPAGGRGGPERTAESGGIADGSGAGGRAPVMSRRTGNVSGSSFQPSGAVSPSPAAC